MRPIAIETTLAYEKLDELDEGGLCLYEVLAGAIGKDPQRDGYGYVKTARKMLLKDKSVVLEAIANIGIKRSVPAEVIRRGGKDLHGIRRGVRRAIRRQVTIVPVEHTVLSNAERSQHHLQLSQLGILDHLMKPHAVRVIRDAVTIDDRVLPVSETLEFFRQKTSHQHQRSAPTIAPTPSPTEN